LAWLLGPPRCRPGLRRPADGFARARLFSVSPIAFVFGVFVVSTSSAPAVPHLHIRPATIADTDTILHFVRELAIYEKAEHEVLSTPAHVHRTMFGAQPSVFGLICELDGQAIGFAVYFFNYSTWQGQLGLYLEDLYVTPQQRGVGAGKALLQCLARIAVERDCGRFEWSVLDWNTPSIQFYDSLGAKPQNEWIRYRMTGKELNDLAAQTSAASLAPGVVVAAGAE
jgi:GNAT superfamily N-acetyltransferase